jgi:hypothetical protein
MLPGRWSARRIALVVASPLIGLAALALVDLVSAGGHGHYVHNVIEPGSLSNLAEIVSRRARLGWGAFQRGNMPWATLAAVLAVAYAVRNRRIYDPVRAPAWHAALLGGLTGGIAGALSEDSGPLLLVVAVAALAALTAYIHGGGGGGRSGRARVRRQWTRPRLYPVARSWPTRRTSATSRSSPTSTTGSRRWPTGSWS